MVQKNRYLFRGRISERKFRDLLRAFALDITADQAARLAGISHNSALALYRLLRERMAELAEEVSPFCGQVEVDESYFGPQRVHGPPGRGSRDKTSVFGILERGGRVYCQIVARCTKETLVAIIEGRVALSAEVNSDGFRSYDGLADAGFTHHHRINKYANPRRPVYVKDNIHINGIESFWSYAKRRLQKFNGLRKDSFPAFLKETEFRFNHRHDDLYKILLASCRMKPLRR